MIKKFFLLLLITKITFCYNITELLSYESELFPKIINLIKQEDKKIAIVYNNNSFELANKLKNLINNNSYVLTTKNQLNIKNFKAVIFTYKNVDKNLLKKLLNNHILILSIYPDEIKNSMISIFIGLKIKPYINIKLIKVAGIPINAILLNIGEIYEDEK